MSTPGKRTLVDAMPAAPAAASPAIQRKPAGDVPVQPPKRDPREAGYLADEYPDHADLGRLNDCGPAAILMIIRVQSWEPRLNTAMNADPVFCAVYPPNGLVPTGVAGPGDTATKSLIPTPARPPVASALKQPKETDHEYLERRQIHYIRTQVTGESVQDDASDPVGSTLSVDWLATHIKPLLLKLGLNEKDFSVVLGGRTENVGGLTTPGEGFVDPNAKSGQYIGNAHHDPTASDAPILSYSVTGDERINQALSYMKSKLLEGAAILLLGDPRQAWGWGGEHDPERQGTDEKGKPLHRTSGFSNGGGHFVVLYDYRPASGEKPTDAPTGKWTILDPSFREPQTPTREQLNAYWQNFGAGLLKPIVVSRTEATQAVDTTTDKPPTATAPPATP